MSIINKPLFFRIPLYTVRRFKSDMSNNDVLVNQNTLIPEILIRLQMQINLDDECVFSIDNLITKCGYVPKTGKGKTIDSFRQALQIIQDHGFISNISFSKDIDFSNVRTSTLLTCTYNENLEVKENKEFTNYCTVSFDDYVTMSKAATGSNLRNMINVYCYLSSKKLLSLNSSTYTLGSDQEKESIRPKFDEKNKFKGIFKSDAKYINMQDFNKSNFYKFGYAFATYETICKEVSEGSNKTLSRTTLSNVLKQLADLGILYYGNINDYVGINTVKKPCNIYAFTAHGFYTGLKFSFARHSYKNKDLYSEEAYRNMKNNILNSLRRGEHHLDAKEDN